MPESWTLGDASLRRVRLLIDGRMYTAQVLRRVVKSADSPRLVVVAYQPNALARAILRVCIQGIQRYTPEPHELWVVDNNSPRAYVNWLVSVPNINVVLNRTEPVMPQCRSFWSRWRGVLARQKWNGDSYANGIGLELAVRLVDPETRHLMTLHMDTMPCRAGWLSFLRSKVDDGVRAAGVRLDTDGAEPQGVLHILGCLIDFQLFRRLNLDFLPQLPQYDVGDRVTVALRSSGFNVFACQNTLLEPYLVESISPASPLRHLHVDRAFDDDGNVIFLHLGRGVRKAVGRHVRGTTAEQWIKFAEEHLLS